MSYPVLPYYAKSKIVNIGKVDAVSVYMDKAI